MSSPRPIRILFVEDDEDDYLLTLELLDEIEPGRYQVDWRRSGDEARLAFATSGWDLCLLDYQLGLDNGLELLAEAKQLGFDAPIVMLTGMAADGLDARASAAGAFDYLVKGAFDAVQLERTIRYAQTRKQIEDERIRTLEAETARREAEMASKAKTDFIAYISHELRTPLTAIIGYGDLVLNHPGLAEPVKGHMGVIKRNARHLQALLNDMLDLSKIEVGKLDLHVQEVALLPLLEEVTKVAGMQAAEHELEFRAHYRSRLPETIRVDATRLKQMLLNLLSNAVKYTRKGGVDLLVECDVEEPGVICFVVRDTGIGVGPEDLARIFEPFNRVSDDEQYGRGAGLGLAITRSLAERFGGSVTATSEIGRGSEFRLTIRAEAAGRWLDATHVEAPVAPQAARARSRLGGRVLVVDDVEEMRTLVSHLLRQAGTEVHEAASGRAALERVRTAHEAQQPYDVILLDMQMPQMNGYEAARALRAMGCNSAIVALTAAVLKGAREACLEAGCNDFLEKPVERDSLVSVVERWSRHNAGPVSASVDAQRVLVVDDAAASREATAALIDLLGFTARTGGCAADAMQIAADWRPAIVLLDLTLGDEDGIALARRLHQVLGQQACIVALSGRPEQDLDAPSRALFAAYLQKPVGLQELQQVLGERPARAAR